MSESILLHFSSKKKSRGYRSAYTVDLPRPITRFESFEVLGAEIPYSFYNCPRGNNSFCDVISRADSSVVDTLYGGGDIVEYVPTDDPLYLVIELDNTPFYINVASYASYGNRDYTEIATIIASYDQTFTACTVAVIGYRLTFTLSTHSSYSKFVFKYASSNQVLVRFLGLTQDAITTFIHPTNTATVQFPGLFYRFNQKYINEYMYGFLGSSPLNAHWNFQLPERYGTQFYVNAFSSGYVDLSIDNLIKIDSTKHILAQKLEMKDGIYEMSAIHTFPGSFTPPKQYFYQYVLVYLFYNTYTIFLNIEPGNYTASYLASVLNAGLQAESDLAGSSATINSDGFMEINLVSAVGDWDSMAILNYEKGGKDVTLAYGKVFPLDLFGFERELWTDFDTPAHTVKYTATKKIKERPFYIRIQSLTLGGLIGDEYVMDDDPLFASSNIIHKIQVNAAPGTIIRDNQKYTTKKIVNKFRAPITSIDFALIDEDQQYLDLNGLDWSISVKINL